MRRRVVLVVAALLVGSGALPALAQPDPLYPVTSFTDWTGGPARDLGDPRAGGYTFQAGIVGGVTRAAERWPAHYEPTRFLDPKDGFQRLADESQAALDAATHVRPDLPYDHLTDAGDPDYMPDWNHDGVFGDPGDYDASTDGTLRTAPFRYACPALDGSVTFETTTGACVAGDRRGVTFRLGTARQVRIVDSRGLVLAATLWLPAGAGAATGAPRLPGVVFSDGIASRQDSYSWAAVRFVRAGYVVLTYDPAGQGGSEGMGTDLFDNRVADCQFGGACRDLQDAVRWFVGAPIASAVDPGSVRSPLVRRHRPALAPTGDNLPNPALGLLDTSRVAIAGNSMGALAVLDYLRYQATGRGADGRPLPPAVAAVAMSGAAPTTPVVPLQIQTSDYDGSPTLTGPGVGGVALGTNDEGIGYPIIKRRYDEVRAARRGSGAMELVVLEGGTHTDHVDTPFVPRTLWSIAVAGDAATDWLDCHVRGRADACARAVAPRAHLSRAFASEQDPDGPAGRSPSFCVAVPDRASLNQTPTAFVAAETGHPVYDCTVPPRTGPSQRVP